MASCESNLYPNVSSKSYSDCDPSPISCSVGLSFSLLCFIRHRLLLFLWCVLHDEYWWDFACFAIIAASVDWHYMTLRNHCQKAGRSTSVPDRAAPESYIAQLFPHRPLMAMAERQIAILKVIVAAQFFSSCYFKVQLLHNVTLKREHDNIYS